MAPKLDGWKVIPFRQAGDDDQVVQYNGFTLSVNDVFFSYSTNNRPIDIILYIRGFEEDNEDWIGAAFILLDGLIGEYNAGTKLGYIDFKSYDESVKDQALSIKKLPEIIRDLAD